MLFLHRSSVVEALTQRGQVKLSREGLRESAMGADSVQLDALQTDSDLPNHLMRLKQSGDQTARDSARS